MIEKIKNSRVLFWCLAVLTVALTGLFSLVDLSEYYIVAVKKDIEGYPFGAEGPVAGIEHYKSAELYAKHMLKWSLIFFALFVLTLYFIIKRKTIGLLFVLILLLIFML